jgi:glycine/D-amino acid oxidase-like deaminating enzyme
VLPERSDVVVIGGGVMGAAALHYLVELGCDRPLLLERDALASGSTGRCAGGVRTLFSDELNRRICEEAIRRLERFTDEVGQQLDLRTDQGAGGDGAGRPGGRGLVERALRAARRA